MPQGKQWYTKTSHWVCQTAALLLSVWFFMTHFFFTCVCCSHGPPLFWVWVTYEEGTKQRKRPNDAPGLTLISLATRICLLLFVTVWVCGLCLLLVKRQIKRAGKQRPGSLLTHTALLRKKKSAGLTLLQSQSQTKTCLSASSQEWWYKITL